MNRKIWGAVIGIGLLAGNAFADDIDNNFDRWNKDVLRILELSGNTGSREKAKEEQDRAFEALDLSSFEDDCKAFISKHNISRNCDTPSFFDELKLRVNDIKRDLRYRLQNQSCDGYSVVNCPANVKPDCYTKGAKKYRTKCIKTDAGDLVYWVGRDAHSTTSGFLFRSPAPLDIDKLDLAFKAQCIIRTFHEITGPYEERYEEFKGFNRAFQAQCDNVKRI